jgi:hypothetical protein
MNHFQQTSSASPIKKSRRLVVGLLYSWPLLLCWLLLQLAINEPVRAAEQRPTGPTNQSPLCRLGINSAFGPGSAINAVDLKPLRLGWYIDYHTTVTPTQPNGIHYMQVIRLRQTGTDSYIAVPSGDVLTQTVAANPGAEWIIGNEPDRIDYQDDIEPPVYAKAYHELYEQIKAIDPAAQILAGAIVQPTPLRLQYLDLVLQHYRTRYGRAMPVDAWSIHNFILNEASCAHYGDPFICWGADIPPGVNATDGLRIEPSDNDRRDLFIAQIIRFRQWMASRGYADKPVYLTEYGILMPADLGFPQSRVNAFMDDTFDYLFNATDPTVGDPSDGGRLVQKFAWYSTNDTVYNGYLYERLRPNDPYTLTNMGRNWIEYTSAITEQIDLFPMDITIDPPAPLVSNGPITFTLTARIANSGNTMTPVPFAVRFFEGDPARGGQLIDSEQTTALAGCGAESVVTVRWPNVTPGAYELYIQVDPADEVVETAETNNVLRQRIFFASEQLFFPLMVRPFAAQ